MPGYDDIYKMWLGHEQKFIRPLGVLGTVPARRLVIPSGAGVIVSTLESVETLGVGALGKGYVTGDTMRVQFTGVGQVEAGEKVEFGKRLKCIGAGKVGQMIDAALAGDAVGDATGLTPGGNFGNQPANDTVDVASDSALDVTQTVTVYGLINGGTVLDSEAYVLTGAATIAGAKSFDTILAVVLSAVCAGTITVEENSAGADIITFATGLLGIGYNAVVDGRCFYGIPDVVADGATTKFIGIIGLSTTGTALSEQITLNGATEVVLANSYSVITHVLIGDLETAKLVSVTVADEEDDENACVGKSIEAAAVDGDIINYNIVA